MRSRASSSTWSTPALRSALASVSPAQPAPIMITRSTSPAGRAGIMVLPSSYVPVDAPNAARASGPDNAAPAPAAAATRSAPRRVYPPEGPIPPGHVTYLRRFVTSAPVPPSSTLGALVSRTLAGDLLVSEHATDQRIMDAVIDELRVTPMRKLSL